MKMWNVALSDNESWKACLGTSATTVFLSFTYFHKLNYKKNRLNYISDQVLGFNINLYGILGENKQRWSRSN